MCPDCEEENTFIKDPDYLFEIPEKGIAEHIPTWVCSACGHEAFEDDGMEIFLNLIEKHEGRAYNHIEIKDGIKTTTVIH